MEVLYAVFVKMSQKERMRIFPELNLGRYNTLSPGTLSFSLVYYSLQTLECFHLFTALHGHLCSQSVLACSSIFGKVVPEAQYCSNSTCPSIIIIIYIHTVIIVFYRSRFYFFFMIWVEDTPARAVWKAIPCFLSWCLVLFNNIRDVLGMCDGLRLKK